MMLETAMQLANTLATRYPGLTDDELGTYRALLVHIEMQMRVATFVIRKQAKDEGMSEDDIAGFTPAEHQ